MTNKLLVCGSDGRGFMSRMIRVGIKPLVAAFVFVGCASGWANEDHLLFVPKPVWLGQEIHVVKVPFVSGYGADFESYLGRIVEPYLVECRSPSQPETDTVDVNPVSIAGIRIVGDSFGAGSCKVKVDYAKVKDRMWLETPDLLRAIVTCVYGYGDGVSGSPDFKCEFELVGVGGGSGLHAELAEILKDMAREREKRNEPKVTKEVPKSNGPVWHDFDISSHEASVTKVDGWIVRISPRDVREAAFREDHLELAISRAESTGHGVWFSSSYGTGSFAVDGRLLFLRYGTGRGTFAREQHVKVFQIGNTDTLEELVDVKVAAYLEPGAPEKGDPVLMEYAVQTTREGTTTTVSFLPPQGVRWPAKVLKIEDGEGKNSP